MQLPYVAIAVLIGTNAISAYQFSQSVPFHRGATQLGTYLEDITAQHEPSATATSSDSPSEQASTTHPIKGKYPTSFSTSALPRTASSRDPAGIKGKYPTAFVASDDDYGIPIGEPDAPPTPVPETEPELEPEFLTATGRDATAVARTKMVLLGRAAGCARGEAATGAVREAVAEDVGRLEAVATEEGGASVAGASVRGTWELVYSDTELFRSSPFFMAGRAVCQDGEEAERYDWFCSMHRKALAVSTIGAVRQIISETRLISEFETKAGAVPFLSDFTPFRYSGGWPVTIEGAIVSSADITSSTDGSTWEIYMDTVEIKGSNLPGARQVLDAGLRLESRGLTDVLERTVPQYATPRPIIRTTYLDEDMRISRDQDGKIFVYVKVSDSEEPTDYSNVMSDLGLSGLLEGLNDNFFKVFI